MKQVKSRIYQLNIITIFIVYVDNKSVNITLTNILTSYLLNHFDSDPKIDSML